MKTLAEYLADYVETEMDQQGFEIMSYFMEWITEGSNAYQSTENCTIVIKASEIPDSDDKSVRCILYPDQECNLCNACDKKSN